MVYGVNNLELGINDILQLIELTLGEGNLNLSSLKKLFSRQNFNKINLYLY